MALAIETLGLTRRFGERLVVDGVNLQVPNGAVYGFLGPNGAGKTTAIRMVLGLLRPNSGSVRIYGIDALKRRRAAARMIGSLVEIPSHYDHLTGRENLDISRRLLNLPANEIDRALELVDLTVAGNRRVGGYSLGMRQRLGVARALLGSPKLLVLDEPTNGLDPDGIADMRRLLRELPSNADTTVLVSSHILAEVEQFATHVGLMHHGSLLIQAPIMDLKADSGRVVKFRVDQPQRLTDLMERLKLPCAVDEDGAIRVLPAAAEAAIAKVPQINFLMVEEGIHVRTIEVTEPSLEDIFHRATASSRASRPDLALAA